MSKIGCVAFADTKTMSHQQLVDLNEGVNAVNAFWSAVQADPSWMDVYKSPLYCCILAALSVRDILHNFGRADARVVRSGLEVREISGNRPHALAIGIPSAPKQDGMWNAHMTVRLGDILLDPSHGQTKRPWNHSPDAVAFLVDKVTNSTIDIEPGCDARVSSQHRYWHSSTHYQITYFELPRSVDLRTRKWRYAPDASLDRRLSLVRSATAINSAQKEAA